MWGGAGVVSRVFGAGVVDGEAGGGGVILVHGHGSTSSGLVVVHHLTVMVPQDELRRCYSLVQGEAEC